ncbi:MAG: hypothetical protein J1F10_06505 [Muribaculaceae bacterium]|nr:hypothetical protein [Muribaculaceae bacterium]
MKDKDSEILDTIVGKSTGLKVPEGYFEQFAANMQSQLPHKDFADAEPRTLWQQVRPYVYLAAMFAGIWCMMHIFGQFKSAKNSYNPVIAEAFSNESFVDDFMLSTDFDEYTLIQEMCSEEIEFDQVTTNYIFPDSI